MKAPNKSGSIEHSIEVAFGLTRAILDNPSLLEEIPNGATVVPLPADDQKQFAESLRIGIRAARSGDNVYLMHLPTLSIPSK